MPKQYIISEGGTRGIPIEVEKPTLIHCAYETMFEWQQKLYREALEAYNAAVEEAKNHAIPIVPAVPEWNGQTVEESKFAKMFQYFDGQWWRDCNKDFYATTKYETRAFLVPIPHTDTPEESKLPSYKELTDDIRKAVKALGIKKEDAKYFWHIGAHGGYAIREKATDFFVAETNLQSKAELITDALNTFLSTTPESREESEKDAEAIAFKYAGYRKQYREKWNHEPTPHAIATWFIENFIITRNP